jgi:dephospho-CoA kinase
MTTKLVLTGSIGMGKTTISEMFRQYGIPVHCSDAAVHEIYSSEHAFEIKSMFGDVLDDWDHVDRKKLRAIVLDDQEKMTALELFVGPLLTESYESFARKHTYFPMIVYDVPLYFESKPKFLDGVKVVVASAPASVQRARVLARPNMTAAVFETILAKQMPDRDKRKMADFIIDTGGTLEETEMQVTSIIKHMIAA